MRYAITHLDEAMAILRQLDVDALEAMVEAIAALRNRGGRLFFLGVGGSAANCSHAVNDFRKIVGIEAYAPTDNVSELTARTNDEGWASVFVAWLKTSRLTARDALFVMSVGGGDLERAISPNLVSALDHARAVGAGIFGIVGRDGGYTAKVGDHVVIVPTVNPETVTPHTEAFQAVIWHLLVSHPRLKRNPTKWESATHQTGRAVFFDRDGVLNRAVVRAGKPYPPASLAELDVVPGASAATRALRDAGFALIVVTNQPDVATGITQRATVDAINNHLQATLGLDAVLTCFHLDTDDCACRKPRPGLLLRMRDEHGIDLTRSFLIGDRWRDIEAGHAAGCTTVFIDHGYDERRPASPPDYVCHDLGAAVDWILSRPTPIPA